MPLVISSQRLGVPTAKSIFILIAFLRSGIVLHSFVIQSNRKQFTTRVDGGNCHKKMGNTIYCPPSHPHGNNRNSNHNSNSNSNTKTILPESTTGEPETIKQKNYAKKQQSWKVIRDRFTAQLLHESFLIPPIRASTVEAAAQYVAAQKTLMPGTHKHLGGAYDPIDGCIYGVPANSRSIMCLKPMHGENNTVIDDYQITTIPLPESVAEYRMKWLRGIFADGYMWAIPSWAPKVLCLDVDAWQGRRSPVTPNQYVHLLDLPPEHILTTWQWHGAGINHQKTAIYCIPSNARHVLKVDLQTRKTSLIPVECDRHKYPNFDIELSNKWYGGIVGRDNCVYGIPYRSCAVLRIDTTNDSARIVGPDYGNGKYNWHGGIQVNGKIYAHPSHANTVLVIDTRPEQYIETNGTEATTSTTDTTASLRTTEPLIFEISIQRASYDTDTTQNYKWLGGAVGVDGNIYCPACDTSAVLKVDTHTDTCSTFGFCGTDKNKWQGGVLGRDGCVYCIPANGQHVLRIHTNPIDDSSGEQPVQLVGHLPAHKDKWQGGSQGKDGALYFIPENGYRVLKVTPPKVAPKLMNGALPENDVIVELV